MADLTPSTARTPPSLTRIGVPGSISAWAEAGFSVVKNSVWIGGVEIREADAMSWTFDGLRPGIDDIDGIPTSAGTAGEPSTGANPNGVNALDHVVMMSRDLRRSVRALEEAGFEVRRRRDIGSGRQQVFFWAGPTIIELVGPIESGDDASPSQLWGLAVSTTDIDRAAELLGEHLSTPKTAVQPGRRIATVRTQELGIGCTIALMTPHVSSR